MTETIESDQERVLVIYTKSDDGRSRTVSEILADDLRRDGFCVEVSDARLAPPPQDYDAVVLGSGIRFGRAARPAIRYIEEHCDALSAMPAFWFSIDDTDSDERIRQLSARTSWEPTDSATFGAPDREALPHRILATLRRHRADAVQLDDVHAFAIRIAEQIPTEELQVLRGGIARAL